eukprot:Blabericola_migrator_1__9029@NODE_4804_length_974_cov_322_459757_g2995_i0_p2_GENE_NODE_4804_length_974_cov_322_459757_g2995_i0NODE_4804_length_974_cov_322_459757_g2995_i0_p2_ORF_typecomplete_len153_score34_28_NODE_4804_length_974_cov_322_459757_g2995_i0513971
MSLTHRDTASFLASTPCDLTDNNYTFTITVPDSRLSGIVSYYDLTVTDTATCVGNVWETDTCVAPIGLNYKPLNLTVGNHVEVLLPKVLFVPTSDSAEAFKILTQEKPPITAEVVKTFTYVADAQGDQDTSEAHPFFMLGSITVLIALMWLS